MTDLLDDFLRWRFESFHTAACRAHLEDPGARCLCRPPAAETPKQPTQHEIERTKREDA